MIALFVAASTAAAVNAAVNAPLPAAEQGVSIVERLGAPIPKGIFFRDTDGQEVAFDSLLGHDRPLVVYLGYSRCAMLCDTAQSSLAKLIPGTKLALGKDFDVVTVSIDPHETVETARDTRRARLQSMGLSPDARVWPFLVGDAKSIGALSDALGDRYRYDDESQQFVHAAAFFLITPDGSISRYLYGLPESAHDLRLALVEASEGRVGTSFDHILLICWHYDPSTRRYGWAMSFILKGGALAIMGGLGSLLGIFWWREYRAGTIR